MNDERRVARPRIEIPREQAIRYLGMHRGNREPKEAVMRLVEEEFAQATALIEPRAVTRCFPDGIAGSDFFPGDVPVALVVCTIGGALEARVHELMAAKDAGRAMILDAIGSAAAEEVADHCNLSLCETALAAGRRPDRRSSPGYGKWKLVEQRWIFDLLEPAEIGVTLSERCMMTPRKSVSFGMPLEGGDDSGRSRRRCIRCGMVNCEYRET